MVLSNEIRRLTQGFLEGYDDRIAVVAAIRDNTAQELSRFRAAHEHMAAEQRERLSAGRMRLASDVSTMRQHLAVYVNGLRDNIATAMKSLHAAHEHMAAEQGQRLAHVDAARKRTAVEQHQRLAAYLDGLRRNVTTILKTIDAAHQSMAIQQRQRLAAGRVRLASDVSKVRGDLQADRKHLASEVSTMRGELQADQSEAHETWNSFTKVMQKRRAMKSGAPSPKAAARRPAQTRPQAAAAPRAAVRSEVSRQQPAADDLGTITGIGPGWQQRLNEMGIRTFAQLASSTPKKIRKAFGAPGRLAKVEQWIEEAQRRSSVPAS